MSNDLNQCQFIGRLGRDVEMRFLPNGDPVANFSLACGWKTKDKDGVEWVAVVVFGKLAEICGQYLKKGAQVFIQGRMRTEKYTDKTTGVEKYSVKIVADRMQMLGGKTEGGNAGKQDAPPPPDMPDMDDDIPF
jgi:single-strand DNA-binding protein